MARYVIVHPEMGVYLGSCLGMGFWSCLDCVGQDRACTAESIEDARTHVASWEESNDPDEYQYVPVELPIGATWATARDLTAADVAEKFVAPLRGHTLQ